MENVKFEKCRNLNHIIALALLQQSENDDDSSTSNLDKNAVLFSAVIYFVVQIIVDISPLNVNLLGSTGEVIRSVL